MIKECLYVCEHAGTEGECERVEVPGWRPFSTAPMDGTRFLAATKFCGSPCVALIWWDLGRWAGDCGNQRFDAWMPLPEPPE